MVVIKPKRDFTSLNRVSYAASNTAKPSGAATTIAQYKHDICSTWASALALATTRSARSLR